MSETWMQTNLACLFVAEAQIRIRNVTYWPLEEEGGKVVKSAACSLCTYIMYIHVDSHFCMAGGL